MSTYKAACELVGRLEPVSRLDGLEVAVTLDQQLAQSAIDVGAAVVFIGVPDVEDMSGAMLELEFQILIIAPSRIDKKTAWRELDRVLAAVDETIGLDSARAYDWRTPTGETFPAFDTTYTQIRPKEKTL